MQGLQSLQSVTSTVQSGVISQLALGAFQSFSQITNNHMEQNWPQSCTMRITAGGWSPARCTPSALHWALPFSQVLTQHTV